MFPRFFSFPFAFERDQLNKNEEKQLEKGKKVRRKKVINDEKQTLKSFFFTSMPLSRILSSLKCRLYLHIYIMTYEIDSEVPTLVSLNKCQTQFHTFHSSLSTIVLHYVALIIQVLSNFRESRPKMGSSQGTQSNYDSTHVFVLSIYCHFPLSSLVSICLPLIQNVLKKKIFCHHPNLP